jgi:hypothetical protein
MHAMWHAGFGPLRLCEQNLGGSGKAPFVSRAVRHLGWGLALTLGLRYRSIRIDAVHFCGLEQELIEKRKRTKFDRNAIPKEPTQQRLQLLYRTVKERDGLASLVEFLKIPWMTRESFKAEIARLISVLHNLRYVDLPDGSFANEPSCMILRRELECRCPDIRKTKYFAGAEGSFALLLQGRQWQRLESLELRGLQVEQDLLLYTVTSLSSLRHLALRAIASLKDEIFAATPELPHFPALCSLAITEAAAVTSVGLGAYLSRPDTREKLVHLELSGTGILPQNLHEILAAAPCLPSLTVQETVSGSFPLSPVPPLASPSLRTFHFEISPPSTS